MAPAASKLRAEAGLQALPRRALAQYLRLLRLYPVLTKAATSAMLSALGNFLAQIFEQQQKKENCSQKLDVIGPLRYAIYGFPSSRLPCSSHQNSGSRLLHILWQGGKRQLRTTCLKTSASGRRPVGPFFSSLNFVELQVCCPKDTAACFSSLPSAPHFGRTLATQVLLHRATESPLLPLPGALDPSRGPLGRGQEAPPGPPPLCTGLPVGVLPRHELPGGEGRGGLRCQDEKRILAGAADELASLDPGAVY
ncbi:peroxisomal membrane protein 2 isoform X1 [Equus asinus]|uniref:peroxisomal membrane protein 2 isoform X1 n=1 Tax=Equus asinus TaxID=9793 RepID=UPI0038F73A87